MPQVDKRRTGWTPRSGQTAGQILIHGGFAPDHLAWLASQVARILADDHARGRHGRMLGSGDVHVLDDGVRMHDTALLGAGKAEMKHDLYRFGMLLHELATGKAAFTHNSELAIRDCHPLEHPLPVRVLRPDLPVGFSRLVDKLLNKEPRKRPKSIRQVEHRLARWAMQWGSENAETAPTLEQSRVARPPGATSAAVRPLQIPSLPPTAIAAAVFGSAAGIMVLAGWILA